ncbi:MAG: hypothetical protein CVV64_18235 [Candidatus Wallbacteria bacterium HGW-Wallbacteria-1]|uniref:Glycoside hydrolase n=1 Tax=Candidatus Wallbacteria bacterium HGW-Wallbacteria-1 TaxID=2013854 RepID=A0A2N1PJQ6_9BACT|nr:MAG: hypothetical protein CVV64_18235 [Candidatus Wallbacteria bacterium HGW-Wallbacteria-1]
MTHALLLILICSQASGGSKWKNPSEKYLHAHEQFLGAGCPLQNDEMKHFVYFARDREAMYDHPFLKISRFTGAQIMYSWRQIEPSENHYDFSIILKDLDYLKSHGKKLFLQLQDATFDPQRLAVPDYLLTREYDDGAIYQRDDNGKPEGWVAKRWNPRVQRRFALLLEAMGRVLDGKIEGINLQETAIGLTQKYDPTFSPELYVAAVKTNMLALKRAFPESITMQYANFMPGEWLPWDDFGYLRSVYQYGEKIQVSLGAPDLMVRTKGQLNHALAMMHEGKYTVPLGIAVQDGNYIGKTATDQVLRKRDNLVPLLHAFARDFLRVKLMFWSYQEPYFHEDVMPCFETGKLR